VDGDVGQVAQDHPAVVGRGEGRVGGGQGVGSGDGLEPEALGRLRAVEGLPRRDARYHAVGHDQNRVRGRDGGADRVVLFQRRRAVRDDLLGDQGPGRVVEQDAGLRLGVAGGQVGEGVADGVRSGDPALDDHAHLVADDSPGFLVVAQGHDEHGLIDSRSLGERADAVLYQRLSGQGEQLLRHRGAESGANASA
jgi:hypothetical protein